MHHADYLQRLAAQVDDPVREFTLQQLATELGDDHEYRTTGRGSQYITDELDAYIPHFGDGVRRIPLDADYECAWRPDVQHYLAHSWGDEFEYVRDAYDCENFALRLKGLADRHGFNNIGVVIDWSSSHAYNIAVYPGNNSPDLIEPQSDTMLDPDDGDMYDLDHGVVLI